MLLGKLSRSVVVLLCALGAMLMGAWLLSASGPEVQSAPPVQLAFVSPIGNPQLGLRKEVDNHYPAPGSQISYTLFYSNVNPGSQAFNVRLYDVLPPGAQLLSSYPPATVVQGGVLMFTAPSAGPATDEMSVTVQVRVPDGVSHLFNSALVMADGVTPTFASLLTQVAQSPSNKLRLSKLGYTFVLTRSQLVYTLRCMNVSNTSVNDVTVVDVLPTGLSLVGASPMPDVATLPLLRWSLGALAASDVRTMVITVTSPALTGVITNSAVLGAWQNALTQTLFATEVVGSGPILQVTKDGSAPTVDAGGMLVYTIRYQNIGNQTATGVILTDTLPTRVTLAASFPPATVVGQQLKWNLGPLNPNGGGQVVITTTVGPAWGQVLHNVADITGQSGAYPGHTELDTPVRLAKIYLPVVMNNSH